MKLIYLDVDGVLNGHVQHPNGYCGTEVGCVACLNRILDEERQARLVISSAWRYLVHGGAMTLKGFESLLLTHGVACHERVFGLTACDEDYLPPNPTPEDYQREGVAIRGQQILDHLDEHAPAAYVVLDDLLLPVPRLVQTDGKRGLRPSHVRDALAWLREPLS